MNTHTDPSQIQDSPASRPAQALSTSSSPPPFSLADSNNGLAAANMDFDRGVVMDTTTDIYAGVNVQVEYHPIDGNNSQMHYPYTDPPMQQQQQLPALNGYMAYPLPSQLMVTNPSNGQAEHMSLMQQQQRQNQLADGLPSTSFSSSTGSMSSVSASGQQNNGTGPATLDTTAWDPSWNPAWNPASRPPPASTSSATSSPLSPSPASPSPSPSRRVAGRRRRSSHDNNSGSSSSSHSSIRRHRQTNDSSSSPPQPPAFDPMTSLPSPPADPADWRARLRYCEACPNKALLSAGMVRLLDFPEGLDAAETTARRAGNLRFDRVREQRLKDRNNMAAKRSRQRKVARIEAADRQIAALQAEVARLQAALAAATGGGDGGDGARDGGHLIYETKGGTP